MKLFKFFLITFLVAFALPNFAQTSPPFIRLSDARGCEIFVPASINIKAMTLANVAGKCRAGKFEGGVLVGIGWDLAPAGQDAKSFTGLRAGVVSQGRFVGLRISFNQEATLFLNGPNNEPELNRRFKQGEEGYSLDSVINEINILVSQAGGPYAEVTRSFLIDVVQAWDKNPSQMMRTYTAGWGQTTQNTAWVGLSPVQQATSSNQVSDQSSIAKIEPTMQVLHALNNIVRLSKGLEPLNPDYSNSRVVNASMTGAGVNTSPN